MTPRKKIRYTTPILLASIVILLLTDIVTRLWFFTGLNLNFDAANFNNVVTPIAAIISIILFYRALLLTIRQNGIILSQSLKPYFEEKFKRIEEHFERSDRLPHHANRKPVKVKDMINEITAVYNLLRTNPQFQEDISDFRKGNTYPLTHYYHRSYINDARYLASYASEPLWDLIEVENFITDINNSNLLTDDKIHLKKRIRESFVSKYMSFIKSNDLDISIYLIPLLFTPNRNNEIEFAQLHRTKFNKHYAFFKRELYS